MFQNGVYTSPYLKFSRSLINMIIYASHFARSSLFLSIFPLIVNSLFFLIGWVFLPSFSNAFSLRVITLHYLQLSGLQRSLRLDCSEIDCAWGLESSLWHYQGYLPGVLQLFPSYKDFNLDFLVIRFYTIMILRAASKDCASKSSFHAIMDIMRKQPN